jgi:hypothetical protein
MAVTPAFSPGADMKTTRNPHSRALIMKEFPLAIGLVLATSITLADNSTLDAAIGGGLGGAAGAAIGNELGGRDGAIIGGAIGGGVGAAVTTADDHHKKSPERHEAVKYRHYPEKQPSYRFCPPGQAKKGRC